MEVRYVMKEGNDIKTLSTRLAGFLTTQECGIDITNEGRGYDGSWLVFVSDKSPSPTLCIDPPEPFDLLSDFDDA
jgi:hypothetical protein